jgi:hypothetical protein
MRYAHRHTPTLLRGLTRVLRLNTQRVAYSNIHSLTNEVGPCTCTGLESIAPYTLVKFWSNTCLALAQPELPIALAQTGTWH